MNKIRNTIIVSVVLGGLGIYLFAHTDTAPNKQPRLTETAQSIPAEMSSLPAMTTSQLIAASALRVQSETVEKQTSYPNITPKKLEKPFSPVLEGTDIDGRLMVGEDGQLVVDIAVKDFFDYFLSATADVSPEQALDELLRVAIESLPPENFRQVQAMLDNYLAYKESAISLMSQPLLPHDQQTPEYQLQVMEQSVQALRALRREHMPDNQVAAFFGLEEAYEDFTLASIRIQNNPDLTPEQMQAELELQRERLPDVIRNTETRISEDSQTAQEVNAILLSDRQDSDVENALREKGFTEESLQDALAYRKQQREFDMQYALYKKERDQLLSAGLSEDDLASQTAQLLKKYFDSEQSITQAKVKDLSS
jgi:lipase chaperone LimK